jgi:hypothetical protein
MDFVDFLIPMQADKLQLNDKVYLGQERFGTLLTCSSLSPIVVSDNYTHKKYTLKADETVFLPDPVLQYIHEYLPDYKNHTEYVRLHQLMGIANNCEFEKHFKEEGTIQGIYDEIRILYARLFTRARKNSYQ